MTPAPPIAFLSARAKPTGQRDTKAPVAQLDRASDYGSEGLGFESLRVRHFQSPAIQRVAGLFCGAFGEPSRVSQMHQMRVFTDSIARSALAPMKHSPCARSRAATIDVLLGAGWDTSAADAPKTNRTSKAGCAGCLTQMTISCITSRFALHGITTNPFVVHEKPVGGRETTLVDFRTQQIGLFCT